MDSPHSLESLARQAADPATPPEALAQLAKRPEVAALVAANPNTPLRDLWLLAFNYANEVLANPVLPLYLLEQPDLFDKAPTKALHALLLQASLPEWMAASLARHPDALIAAAARWHCALVGDRDLDWAEAIEAMLWSVRLTWSDQYLDLLLNLDMVPPWLFPALLGAEDTRGQSNARLRKTAVRSPACPPDMLQALRQVGADVDGSGAAPPDPALDPRWLERFAQAPHELCLLAIRHPAAPPALLERFAGHAHRDMRQAVAKHPAAPQATLARLAHDSQPHVVLAVARNPAAPPATLAMILAGGACGARVALADHPALGAAQRERLARDREWPVRKAVAASPATPPDLLAELAADANHGVYLAVAANPAAPPAALELLARHANPRARAIAAARLRGEAPPDAGERRSRTDRRKHPAAPPPPAQPSGLSKAAEPPSLSAEDLARHAAHPDSRIRWIAAIHPAAPPELLRALAADPQLAIRNAVACNPATPADVLAWLAEQRENNHYPFAFAVSHNPSADDSLFVRALEHLPPWNAVRNPRLAPERRRDWIWRLFDDHMQRGWNAACLIASLLAHPQCPPARLEQALQSPHWIHRYAVARNPAAPAPLLERLAGEASQLIRFAARQAQAARAETPDKAG